MSAHKCHILISILLPFVIVVLCACDNNPVRDPDAVSFRISGSVKMGVGVGRKDVAVHIHNEKYDETTISDVLGRYEFKAVPRGNYMLEATLAKHIAFPETQKIAIDGDMNAEEIILVDETRIHDKNYVFGRILSSEGNSLSGVEVQSVAQGVVSTSMTSYSGYYELMAPRNEKVSITPAKKGYAFSFIQT